ncbi:hypothetical protein G6F55_013687 [Rhizopus delemar]|nr:hypothetical protein G6F55_013687 [Rhizopus delemar]
MGGGLRVVAAVVLHFQRQGGRSFAFAGAVVDADAVGVVAAGRQAQGMCKRRRQRRPQDRGKRDPQGGAGQEGSEAHGAGLYRSRLAVRTRNPSPPAAFRRRRRLTGAAARLRRRWRCGRRWPPLRRVTGRRTGPPARGRNRNIARTAGWRCRRVGAACGSPGRCP